ncbi:MAG: class I SAM-dependent methyltransferase [Chitinophagaceae bacterium]|nr:class I SAM-dependent methyltransferase [Chitinophagaceae bacterium]MCB9046311.1 class I SAM-dependent methyltransferase [Chitinophagales bacterium]
MLNTNHTICDEKTVNLYNQDYSEKYRHFDDLYVDMPDYNHFVPLLQELTASFKRPIKVLEVGCGTGRYFHALKNTVELTGIDISGPMLKLAETPLKSEEVNIPVINLIEGSVFDYDFGNEKFDFIYSIGVLAEHAPFTKEICDKLFSLLNDDGAIYFTAVDLNDRKNLKRRLAETAYPLLPGKIKEALDKRWVTNYMTHDDLDKMMSESRFDDYNISYYKAEGGGWKGAHLECIANKYDTIARPLFV